MNRAATKEWVNDQTDQELLEGFAKRGSQQAFATLVRRHIDMVYSAARRMVVDPHLAEDVTQAVFVAVALQAEDLRQCAVLSGWLHRTTRNQAAMTVRGEVRRRVRENEAVLMNHDSPENGPEWERLGPQLDEALDQLQAGDRDALLLRFFERKTAREIGDRLGLSEEAAQKRVSRALERLREAFHERGVAVTTTALACAVSQHSVQAAPLALAASVAMASISATALAPSTALGILKLMASTKLKLAVASILTAGLATTIVLQHEANRKLRAELAAHEHETAQLVSEDLAKKQPKDDEATARLRAEHAELMRLRDEITRLRQASSTRVPAIAQSAPVSAKAAAAALNEGYISSEQWQDVGSDTPDRAFQTFFAALKTGEKDEIVSKVHWEVGWKDEVTDEDKKLVEKSMQDYLDLLGRASKKISAFSLAPVGESPGERTRVFFQTLTPEGEKVDSSFEMVKTDSGWRPLLSMRWLNPKDDQSFVTSPVFGPKIDLEP